MIPEEFNKTLWEREEESLAKAICNSLSALASIAWDDEHPVSDRIDAASRVLAYASSIGPEDLLDDGGDYVPFDPEPEGDEDAC